MPARRLAQPESAMNRPTAPSARKQQHTAALARLLLALPCALILLTGCKPVGPNYNRPTYSAPASIQRDWRNRVVPPPNPAGGSWQPANPSDGMLQRQMVGDLPGPATQPARRAHRHQQRSTAPGNRELPGRARPGHCGARQLLPNALRQHRRTATRVSSNQPSSTKQTPPPQRLHAGRPGQLGAGLLGPHPPHR